MKQNFVFKQFVIITLLVSIWINLSEIFRYFLLVRPRVKLFFQDRSDIAQMDWVIFSIWGSWDLLLTAVMVFIFWLCAKSFGNNHRAILISATAVWAAVFVIFWVATANMGLSNWKILLVTLPMSLLEMLVGVWIASKLYATQRWLA